MFSLYLGRIHEETGRWGGHLALAKGKHEVIMEDSLLMAEILLLAFDHAIIEAVHIWWVLAGETSNVVLQIAKWIEVPGRLLTRLTVDLI